MKKFFVTLLILLILGGGLFLLGWPQLSVPAGSYGVIISKTHGVDPVPVSSGEFRWLWYKLIPTNVKVAVFRLDPVNFTINHSSTLPAGESYAAFAGLRADFSWDLRAIVSFRIRSDMLVSIVEQNNIADQEGLNAFIQDISLRIESIIIRNITSMESDTERLERILAGDHDDEIYREITEQFPQISDFLFTIQSARFPDFALYRQVRLLFEEFLARQREVISAGFVTMAESHIASHLYFDELRRYGELFTQFPVLLEFLAMDINRRHE